MNATPLSWYLLIKRHIKSLSYFIYIYKFTSECHSQNTPSLGRETLLAPSANKQTRNYDIECSNHHPSLSTLRSKGLSRSKMKWWAIYIQIQYYIYIYIYIYKYINTILYIYIFIYIYNVIYNTCNILLYILKTKYEIFLQ